MMKKTSIKNIFKKDKSPSTPTEEVWGELCTTTSNGSRLGNKSPKSPGQLTPKSNGSSRKLDLSNSSRDNGIKGGRGPESKAQQTSSRRASSSSSSSRNLSSNASKDSEIKSRRVSESNIRTTSQSSRSNGLRSASEHNLSTQRISRSTHSSRHSTPSIRRFPSENYVSTTAVDVDAPIEDYAGPIDCDEVSVSSGSEHGREGDAESESHNLTTPNCGDSPTRADVDAMVEELLPERQGSPDTIPVVYEDCYDSDSWSANNLRSSLENGSDSVGNVHPLTARYTNDETMDMPKEEEEDTVYSVKVARSEEDSLMAPMSIDDEDDGQGFGRMETDESALDDEDYYRQDYFSLMTKSKRMMYEKSESIVEGEEERATSLSERVLMSDDSGDGAGSSRLSSRELTGMTEPDLPSCENGVCDDEEGDYGDLYTDASFPLANGEEEEPDVHATDIIDESAVVDEKLSSTGELDNDVIAGMHENCDNESNICLSKSNEQHILEPQDRVEEASRAASAPLLPEDSDFEETVAEVAGSSADLLPNECGAQCVETAEDEIDNVVVIDNINVEDPINGDELETKTTGADELDTILGEAVQNEARSDVDAADSVTDNAGADSNENTHIKNPEVDSNDEKSCGDKTEDDQNNNASAKEIAVTTDDAVQGFLFESPRVEAEPQNLTDQDDPTKSEDPSLSESQTSCIAETMKSQVLPDESSFSNAIVANAIESKSINSTEQSLNTPKEITENAAVAQVVSLSKDGEKMLERKGSVASLDDEKYVGDNETQPETDKIMYDRSKHDSEAERIQRTCYVRSRSLSPAPHPKPTSILDRPYAAERTKSLPVRWHPFPVSSPHASLHSSKHASSNDCECSNDGCTDKPASQDNTTTDLSTYVHEHRSVDNNAQPPSRNKLIDIDKIVHENHRLRVKRQQLCESLGSMAQQFQEHERVSAEKIFGLEQKIRALTAERESSTCNKTGQYGAEIVRQLSVGVLQQDKLLETKDQQISQLSLRLEVMKHTLHEREESHHAAKRQWEKERLKLHNCLMSSEKMSLFTLQEELLETRASLNAALSDIDALTSALESNNELLDTTVEELEVLREFKANHSTDDEFSAPAITRSAIPFLSSSKNASNISRLQGDLDQRLVDLNELRELVATADGKSCHDLEAEVTLLRGEANASRLEAKFAGQRIHQLTADLKDKIDEITKLRYELDSLVSSKDRSQNYSDNVEAKPKSPDSDYWSSDLKDFTIVSDLEAKILFLEKKIAEYEKPTLDESEAVTDDTQDEDMDGTDQAVSNPSKQKNVEESEPHKPEDSPSKRPPESPLTARRLFQPLRRGWANASPLNKMPLADSNDRDDSTNKKDVAKLAAIIKANTEVMDKLKQDIIKAQSEKEEIEFEMTSKVNQLQEENAALISQITVLETAFREMNDKRASDGDEMTDDGLGAAEPLSPSAHSEKSDTTLGNEDLHSKNIMTLQRSITELESTQSHQEDEIERLKSELVKVRVTSQQEKEAALNQLREEVAIVTAQRTALENQLIEINKSAGLLRDSLNQAGPSPNKKNGGVSEPTSPKSTEDDSRAGGSDPILVAQVVMLENANKVLEKTVNSLRVDLQTKLTPLLEKVAMLEEEKRIMEDEMNVKLECREMTIKNLESSLQQLNASRFGSGKKKRHTRVDSPLPSPT